MQFSIKDLLGVVAFCSVIAWCAAMVGVDNGMFWAAMGVVASMSYVFVRVARSERHRRLAWAVPLPFLLCCMVPFASPTVLLDAVLLLLIGALFVTRCAYGVRSLTMAAMVSAAIAAAAGVLPGLSDVRKLRAMREKYPVVALTNRLKYEQTNRPADDASAPEVSLAVRKRLDEFESELNKNSFDFRRRQLLQLHSRQYELFVRSSGFGVGRMVRPRPNSLDWPELENIAFNGSSEQIERGPAKWRSFFDAGASNQIEHLHKVSRGDFLDPESFGATIETPGQVAGFVEHAFHYPPTEGMTAPERWRIDRLELVSLLRFDEPRVYVLDHLPRMDQLSDDEAPTRPLDEFESNSLEQLYTQEDIVVSQQGERHRMLGSLRAAQQCLDCHGVKRAELLGAFSYVLSVTRDAESR